MTILGCDAPSTMIPPRPPACALHPRQALGGVAVALTAEGATSIFLAKTKRSNELAKEFSISTKAVRDIWNLRTWARTTEPYWSTEDADKYVENYAKMIVVRMGRTAMQPTALVQQANTVETANERHPASNYVSAQAPGAPTLVQQVNTLETRDERHPASSFVSAQAPEVPTFSLTNLSGQVQHAQTVKTDEISPAWIIETAFVEEDFNALLTEWEAIKTSLVV